MNKLALAAGLLAALASTAHASHSGYLGGCTKNATVPPGAQTHVGTVSISAWSATAAGVPTFTSIAFDCELVINGMSLGIQVSASGTGFATNTDTIEYYAEPADDVRLCEHVTVDGHQVLPVNCHL